MIWRMVKMGVHIVVDLFGVNPKLISEVEVTKKILDEAIERSKLISIKSFFHQFSPHGVSCIYLLATSHVSLHSWPEIGYAALDIFVCDKDEKAFKFLEVIKEKFKPEKIETQIIKRDYYERNEQPKD